MYYQLNEEFADKNKTLIDYLTVKLQALPGHDEDRRRAAACREAGLCQLKNDKEKRNGKGE
jgi:hypothetical protein